MFNLKNLFIFAALPVSLLSQAALAQNVTVSGQMSVYPILVQAHNIGCNGLTPTSFGYSVDNRSTYNRGYTVYDINKNDTSVLAGSHVIHFKSWNRSGECPRLDVPIVVSNTVGLPPPPAPAPTPPPAPAPPPPPVPVSSGPIPSYAVASGDLVASSRWSWKHDPGTPGSSTGTSTYPVSDPSVDGASREFSASYSDHGGEIYHLSFATDSAATHFVYDTMVYVADPSQLANLELDMNDVTAGGQTYILGTQCSTYSKSWEYTTLSNGSFHWNKSNIPCNPLTWTANTWHHIQIASHRDNSGVATYDWVNFDGTVSYFDNATGYDAKSLGWAPGDLLINVQLDGSSVYSGSMKLYLDKLVIYRW